VSGGFQGAWPNGGATGPKRQDHESALLALEWKVNDADEMTRIFGLIGVPSSAGAHYPGQEKAPAALRRAGLATRLAGAGISILDYGDLPSKCCGVDPITRNIDRIADVRTICSKRRSLCRKNRARSTNPF
jgi:arginase family enzyme